MKKIGLGGLLLIVAVPLLLVFFSITILIVNADWMSIGDDQFARNGVSQIQPAAEMEELFDDCRHYIGSERDLGSTWNATAYFGERYVLEMRVPVDIKSKTSGSMIGEPKFYLLEIESVSISPSGGISASFSREIKFDEADWKKVYDSGGDISSIGFTLNSTPVPNFQDYADAARPSY